MQINYTYTYIQCLKRRVGWKWAINYIHTLLSFKIESISDLAMIEKTDLITN